jgi:hypothetical protein
MNESTSIVVLQLTQTSNYWSSTPLQDQQVTKAH